MTTVGITFDEPEPVKPYEEKTDIPENDKKEQAAADEGVKLKKTGRAVKK